LNLSFQHITSDDHKVVLVFDGDKIQTSHSYLTKDNYTLPGNKLSAISTCMGVSK